MLAGNYEKLNSTEETKNWDKGERGERLLCDMG